VVIANNTDKLSKVIEKTIIEKSSNKTRLEKIEADYILKQIGGPHYEILAEKYINSSGQYYYLSVLESTIVEFFLQRHIEFLKNIRDIFFYFDLSYNGTIKKVN